MLIAEIKEILLEFEKMGLFRKYLIRKRLIKIIKKWDIKNNPELLNIDLIKEFIDLYTSNSDGSVVIDGMTIRKNNNIIFSNIDSETDVRTIGISIDNTTEYLIFTVNYYSGEKKELYSTKKYADDSSIIYIKRIVIHKIKSFLINYVLLYGKVVI